MLQRNQRYNDVEHIAKGICNLYIWIKVLYVCMTDVINYTYAYILTHLTYLKWNY